MERSWKTTRTEPIIALYQRQISFAITTPCPFFRRSERNHKHSIIHLKFSRGPDTMFLLESKAMSLFDLGCLQKSAMRVQLPLMTRGHCTAKVSRWPIHWHSLMSRSGPLFMEVKRCFEDFWTDTVPTMIVAVTCLRHSLARSQSVDCCCQQSLVFWVLRRWLPWHAAWRSMFTML